MKGKADAPVMAKEEMLAKEADIEMVEEETYIAGQKLPAPAPGYSGLCSGCSGDNTALCAIQAAWAGPGLLRTLSRRRRLT